MTDLRAEFESWIWAQGRDAGKYEDGEYYVPTVERLWGAWQASRAALKVNLPKEQHTKGRIYQDLEYAFAYNDAINACQIALTDAGISYD
jgi:hypothetical protein